jgi:hypothetical protein
VLRPPAAAEIPHQSVVRGSFVRGYRSGDRAMYRLFSEKSLNGAAMNTGALLSVFPRPTWRWPRSTPSTVNDAVRLTLCCRALPL